MAFMWTVAFGLVLATAIPTTAQQRLFVRMPREVVELDPRLTSLGALLRRFPLPANDGTAVSDTEMFGGGESLVWVTGSASGARLALLNTRTGAVQLIAVPGFVPSRVLGGDGVSRLVVLGSTPNAERALLIADARSGQLRTVDIGPTPIAFSHPIAYAARTDLLFTARSREPLQFLLSAVDVRHASTGALVKTIDIAPVSADVLSANEDGTLLYVTDAEHGTFVYDVASGQQLAGNVSEYVLQSALRTPTLDESRNRLLVNIEPALVGFGDGIGISVFSADSLQRLGRVRVPELPLPPPSRTLSSGLTQTIESSGASATLLVLQAVATSTKYGPAICRESQLIALDASTGRLRGTVNTTAALGDGSCLADMIRLTEPAPPRAGKAAVAGHQVTLQWQAAFGATQYEVEAGSAPGLANIARFRVTDTQLVVSGVPAGVYYVRVRSLNAIGSGPASGELRVVVP